jgi:hypothetical protein
LKLLLQDVWFRIVPSKLCSHLYRDGYWSRIR